MTGTMLWLHLLSAAVAALVCGFLFLAGKSETFRHAIGSSDRERAYNFQLTALFVLALGLELLSVPLEVSDATHLFTVLLATLTGSIVVGMFAVRVAKRWI